MSVISVLKNITIAAFILLALVVVAANIKLPQGYGLFVVQSGSMEPAIPMASVVLTKPTADFAAPLPSPRFLKGDVVTFSSGSSLVSHRVVETVEKNGQFFYETKGDANNEADQTLVAEKAVVGKVKLTVPYLGRFVNFAKQPLGYFLMILIPSLYVILSEIWIIIAELRRSRTKISGAGLTLPIALIFAGSLYFVGGTAAFFSDTAESSGNVFQADNTFPQTAPLYDSTPYTCSGGASSTSGPTFGSVVIDKEGTNIIVDVTLEGATASSTYDIWVNQDPGGCPLSQPTAPAALTTDSSGDGTAHVETTSVTGATKFWISAVGGGQVLRSTAVSF